MISNNQFLCLAARISASCFIAKLVLLFLIFTHAFQCLNLLSQLIVKCGTKFKYRYVKCGFRLETGFYPAENHDFVLEHIL